MEILFYIFATLTLLCGLLVVFNPFSRNPVTSAMFLVLTIICMSGLFVLLPLHCLLIHQKRNQNKKPGQQIFCF